MRFVVDREALAWGLQTTGRAVSSRTTLPVLTGILVEAHGEHLILTGTDLDIAIRARVPAVDVQEGAVVLPARYLSEYARRIPFGQVSVEVDTAQHRATLRWERSEYIIQGFAPDQFPAVGGPSDDGPGLSLPGDLLRRMVQQTAFAVSTDETRPTLTGVHLAAGDGLHAIATDGFRVAIHRTGHDAVGGSLDAIVPGRALNELARLLGPEGEGDVAVRFAGSQIHFDLGDARLSSRLIEGQYPNVLDLLPHDYPIRLRVDRDALLEAAERASLMSDSRLASRLIVLELGADRLVIRSQDPEVGQAYEEVPAEVEGEELRIGLNARYLTDGLKAMVAGDVQLEFIDPVKAVRVSSPEDETYRYIVFPVRI
ncbi:MAG TPA: DNA polymerase III subunit beta [Bacillota bacterium]